MKTDTAKSQLSKRLALASKSLFPLITFICCAGPLPAQVPIQLTVELNGTNEVPPSDSTALGTGSLTLIGNNLAYNISLPQGQWALELHGPAGPGINAPLMDSLGSCGRLLPVFSDTAVDANASDSFVIIFGFVDFFNRQFQPPACVVQGNVVLSDAQISDLLAGLLYVEVLAVFSDPNRPPPMPPPAPVHGPSHQPVPGQQQVPLLRGQILPVDSDHDGVPDYRDLCPDTPPGAIVNADGCSIDQLCPCDGPWKNHGEYVNALKDVSATFLQAGLITEEERQALVRQAAASDCGKVQ